MFYSLKQERRNSANNPERNPLSNDEIQPTPMAKLPLKSIPQCNPAQTSCYATSSPKSLGLLTRQILADEAQDRPVGVEVVAERAHQAALCALLELGDLGRGGRGGRSRRRRRVGLARLARLVAARRKEHRVLGGGGAGDDGVVVDLGLGDGVAGPHQGLGARHVQDLVLLGAALRFLGEDLGQLGGDGGEEEVVDVETHGESGGKR